MLQCNERDLIDHCTALLMRRCKRNGNRFDQPAFGASEALEEDGRIYGEFSQALAESYPATSKMLSEVQAEESGHRASLIHLYRSRDRKSVV